MASNNDPIQEAIGMYKEAYNMLNAEQPQIAEVVNKMTEANAKLAIALKIQSEEEAEGASAAAPKEDEEKEAEPGKEAKTSEGGRRKKKVKGGEFDMNFISNTDGLITAANDPLVTAVANVPSLLSTSSPITSGLAITGVDNTMGVPRDIIQSVLPNLGSKVAAGGAKPKKSRKAKRT